MPVVPRDINMVGDLFKKQARLLVQGHGNVRSCYDMRRISASVLCQMRTLVLVILGLGILLQESYLINNVFTKRASSEIPTNN